MARPVVAKIAVVGLSVAAILQGLPAALIIVVAIGVRRAATRRVRGRVTAIA